MDKLVQSLLKRLTPLWETLYFFYQRFIDYHRISSWFDMASGTTYYFLLGFLPFLVFTVNLMLFVMATQVDALYGMAAHYLPDRMAGPLMGDIKRIMDSRSTLWMWVTGLFSLYSFVQGLVILTRATDSLDYANTAAMARDDRHNILIYAKGIIFTFGLMVVIFLSLGLPVFGNSLVYLLNESSHFPAFFLTLWNFLRVFLPFVVLVVWLTGFYIFAPHSYTPPFRQAFITALLVTFLWLAATGIYSWCMTLIPGMGIAYGSLFGLFALFVWFKFIVSFIIYGIEFLMAFNEIELRHKIAAIQAQKASSD
ncbi:putative ribonuclease BN [Selenomonas ruminantium subsp. lactilytica TAM6421]|uniref:Putative ribonuclease BN n=1 Tax=Selenomonas ruminantium subsp. lactilytica (strain NBRC 103574 / TAM6421) TaxID=927704 RepID=I0GQ28_SELRL|nr:YhjD/YihY/BrkB family envelope integrity protein [Selenomonas ruminantium]BAL82865.1 putative ribonuclease BN [Selenomonas ruminantium subsp. lactilytica TAM6421]